MRAGPASPVSWVHLLQALVARELVEEQGVPSRRVAALLGLAPSAVSQYLSGKRLAGPFIQHSTDARSQKVARRVSQTLLHAPNDLSVRTRILLEGAVELSGAVPTAPAVEVAMEGGGAGEAQRQMAKWLRARVLAEQAAVTACMRLAQKARDEMTRAVFRQIAADSLRHAEIVASLVTYLDRGVVSTSASGVTRHVVELMIEAERRAEEQAGKNLAKSLGGMMSILAASMEADERKHAELLQGMLAMGFAEGPADPGAPRRGNRSRRP